MLKKTIAETPTGSQFLRRKKERSCIVGLGSEKSGKGYSAPPESSDLIREISSLVFS